MNTSLGLLLIFLLHVISAHGLDFTSSRLIAADGMTKVEQKAITMFLDELGKRGHKLSRLTTWPGDGGPIFAICRSSELENFAPFALEAFAALNPVRAKEGYSIFPTQRNGSPVLLVVGNDDRGVMFGVGRLLRELRIGAKTLHLSDTFQVSTAPKYPLRGHQLGYRPKTNSYDAWDMDQWEQYFRDLIIFGCNAIELIPPRSDDDATSPHFPKPPMEMMIQMSRLAEEYGLDVWIWYPAMDKDYTAPATIQFALKEWADVFTRLPRINAIFVPGGDPGHTQPRVLMDLLAKQTENLRRFHPKAGMWVSPQSFTAEGMNDFLGIVQKEKPAWLAGIVFGPQVRMKLPDLRAAIPERYPIRHYPDITHSRQCQYPVADWDVAFAVTEARECINPRPVQESIIFRETQSYTMGFLTYSEGCNDDVNKAIWSALGWDPEMSPTEILRQFSGYFIGDQFRNDFADGLLALEQNWCGPLLSNEGVTVTLEKFQVMERRASPEQLKNWRFQQGLFRAYYDAYVRARLIHETAAEERALDKLREARKLGANSAIAEAKKILDEAAKNHPALDLRKRIFDLAEDLYRSIRMQLSVSKYKAIAVDRGAALDTIDYPLNNRVWLREQFVAMGRLKEESEKLAGIERIVNWTNPGPGGFYDDPGNLKLQPHLVRGLGFEKDPGAMTFPRMDYEEDLVVDEPDENPGKARRLSWMDHAESLYDAPLKMRYSDLDPLAAYKVRVVYAGDSPKKKMRLEAGGMEVHPLIQKPFPYKPIEFDIPREATKDGRLELTWHSEPGLGGNGRGCQVSEVWLIKK